MSLLKLEVMIQQATNGNTHRPHRVLSLPRDYRAAGAASATAGYFILPNPSGGITFARANNRLAVKSGNHSNSKTMKGKTPSMSTVQERVVVIVAEVLGVKPEDVDGDCSFTDDLGADSLDTVELIMAFEEEFCRELSDNETEQMATVKDVIDYFNERLD